MKTMRNHYAAIRMTKIQNTDDTRWWQGCGTTGIFILAAGKANGIPMLEDSLASFFFFFFKQNETYSYYVAQQLCSLVFIQMN